MNDYNKDSLVFLIEIQYQEFKKNMYPHGMIQEQERQIKDAFYAAWGQLLVCMRDQVATLPEEEGAEVLENMLNQVVNRFKNQN